MYPEDLFYPGTYVDTVTGDIWEKHENGQWYVNGALHKPFPHSLAPEPVEGDNPSERQLRDKNGYTE